MLCRFLGQFVAETRPRGAAHAQLFPHYAPGYTSHAAFTPVEIKLIPHTGLAYQTYHTGLILTKTAQIPVKYR